MGEKEMESVLYFGNEDGTYHALGVLKEGDLTSEANDEVYHTFDYTRTFSCTAQLNPADMHKLDVMLRPYVIYCNPKDEHFFEEYKKKGFIVCAHPLVEEGMGYIIDRSKIELAADLW